MFSTLKTENILLLATTIWFLPLPTKAQITPDGSLPTNVERSGNVLEINGGERRGGNLFHSFRDFSVPTGNEAFFNNAQSIENIINRVTGGNISSIDGLIGANGSANLFLLNPAGILFGPNARLNIGGSFFGSTADSILFPDGNEFSAIDSQSRPILTINAPIGLNLRENPADIQVQGSNLAVPQGQNFTLVGGNVSLEGGSLTAREGRVDIGGLLATGIVDINATFGLDFPDNVPKADVFLRDGAFINVRGEGGGFITVNTRNLELTEGSAFRAGIGQDLVTSDAQAGDIVINASETTSLDGSFIDNDVRENAVGNAGNINLTTGNLFVVNSSRIGSNIFVNGNGNGGNVSINASDLVSLAGNSNIRTQVRENAIGNAGNIQITTNSLSLKDNSLLVSDISGRGNAGSVTINVTDNIAFDNSRILSGVNQEAVGNSGNINITTTSLQLNNDSLLRSSIFGEGTAGDLTINTSEDVSLQASNLQSQLKENASGQAGNITINANSLFLTDRSRLLTNTEGQGNAGSITINTKDTVSLIENSLIFSQIRETAVGNGGDINIVTGKFSLVGTVGDSQFSQLISNTRGTGDSGDINIQASESILLDRGRLLASSGEREVNPEGNSGDINLTAPQISLNKFSFLSAAAPLRVTGEAGNITINGNAVSIADGTIVNTLSENAANGGDITVNAQNLELTRGGKIVAAATSSGSAGNIILNVTEEISLDGSNPFPRPPEIEPFEEEFLNELVSETGLFANTSETATGNGGSIQITNPVDINIINVAQISTASEGQGNGGTLSIQSDNLTLDNQGAIQAFTTAGEGGNIVLGIKDNLFLRDNNNRISAQAINNANGGNIDIDAKFIVALPNQNNDILANAQQGLGGNIDITAEAIFGLQERSNNPFTNDIDASSDFGLDGSVSINTPDVDATQGVTELQTNAIEPQETVAQACSASTAVSGSSSLTITGRGGLPSQPTDPLTADAIHIEGKSVINRLEETDRDREIRQNLEDTDTDLPDSPSQGSEEAEEKFVIVTERTEPIHPDDIIPARGMIVKENGEIILTGYPTPNTTQRSLIESQNCSVQ
jgi:filamentous hemagglutinin family protein